MYKTNSAIVSGAEFPQHWWRWRMLQPKTTAGRARRQLPGRHTTLKTKDSPNATSAEPQWRTWTWQTWFGFAEKTFEHLWHKVTDFNMVSTENSSTGLYNQEEGRSHSNPLTQRPFNVNNEPGSFTFGSQYRCEPITPRFRGGDG